MNELFLRYLIPAAVAGTLGTAAALFLSIFRKKLPAAAERAVLIGSAVLFLLPFRLFSGLIPASAAESPDADSAGAAFRKTFFYRIGERASGVLPEEPAGVWKPRSAAEESGAPSAGLPSARAALPFLYAAGSFGLLVRGLLRHAVFRRKLNRSLLPPSGRQTEIFLELCRAAGIKKPPPFRRSALISVPVLAGFFSPVIVFPANDAPEHVFRAAVRHELEHLAGRDLPAKALAGLVCCVHWFNPAAWLLRGRLASVMELRSDERAASRLPERQRFQYAEAILWFSGDAGRLPAAGFAACSKRKVRCRMEHILHPVRPSRRRTALLSAVTVLLLTAGLLAGCDAANGAGELSSPSPETAAPVTSAPSAGPSDLPQNETPPADGNWATLYTRPGQGASVISDVELFGDPQYILSIPDGLLLGAWGGADEPLPVQMSAPDDCYRPEGSQYIPVAMQTGGESVPAGSVPPLFRPEGGGLALTVDAVPESISLQAAESGAVRYLEDAGGLSFAVLGYAVDAGSVPVYTLYVQMDEVLVQNGEHAEAGQEIGKIRISGEENGVGFTGFNLLVAFHNTSKLFAIPGAAGTVSGTLETPLLFPVETFQLISRGFLSTVENGIPYEHAAIDIAGPNGTNVLAADRGVVAAAGFDPVRGYFLVLEHAGGFQTLYTHLSEIFAEEGADVARGEVIAALGSSGQSTGPHLHFEVLLDGAAQNPEEYLGDPPERGTE